MKRAVIEGSRMSDGDQPGLPKHKLFFFTGESKAAVETSQPTNFGLKKTSRTLFLRDNEPFCFRKDARMVLDHCKLIMMTVGIILIW